MKPVFVIAEAGVNHNGSVDLARRLIDVAAESGANAVKFQTFRPECVVTRTAGRAEYQIVNTGTTESQLEMVRRLELSVEEHETLIVYARERGIEFLSTPFDVPSVHLLTGRFRLPKLKIASGEITNLPLMLAAGRAGCPLIISTGMATLAEVEQTLAAVAFAFVGDNNATPSAQAMAAAYRSGPGQEKLREKVTLLHCTTEYPAPAADVNLRAMQTMQHAFGLPVGYSDHTLGIHVSVAAVAAGASIIEKHFTLDRKLPGPDHVASLEPSELIAMVAAIREVEQALGDGRKRPAESEVKNIAIARKSLVAAGPIRKGEAFTAANLTTKRPGTGISAMRYYEFLGRRASRDYADDDLIEDD